MKRKWSVIKFYQGGEYVYRIYKLDKNDAFLLHDQIFGLRSSAIAKMNELNKEEAKK